MSTDPQGTGQEEGTMEGHEEGTMEGANGELHGSEDAGDGKGVDENENGNDDAVDAGGNDSVAAEHEDAGGNDSVAAEAEATTAEVAYTHTHTHTSAHTRTHAHASVMPFCMFAYQKYARICIYVHPKQEKEWEKPSLPESRVDWIRVEGLKADANPNMVAGAFKKYGKVVEAFVDETGSKPYVFVRLAGDSGASTEAAQAEDAALCVDSAIRNLNQSEMGEDKTIVTVVKAPPLHQLFVGNLPNEVTSDDVKELFAKMGTVTRVNVVETEEGEGEEMKKVGLGYAFVEFATASEAEKAVNAINLSTFKERLLRVDYADCRSNESKRSCILFIDQLPRTFSDREKLRNMFSKAGQIVDCYLATGPMGPKGFGFIEYEAHAMALEAYRDLQGEKIDDQPFRICFGNPASWKQFKVRSAARAAAARAGRGGRGGARGRGSVGGYNRGGFGGRGSTGVPGYQPRDFSRGASMMGRGGMRGGGIGVPNRAMPPVLPRGPGGLNPLQAMAMGAMILATRGGRGGVGRGAMPPGRGGAGMMPGRAMAPAPPGGGGFGGGPGASAHASAARGMMPGRGMGPAAQGMGRGLTPPAAASMGVAGAGLGGGFGVAAAMAAAAAARGRAEAPPQQPAPNAQQLKFIKEAEARKVAYQAQLEQTKAQQTAYSAQGSGYGSQMPQTPHAPTAPSTAYGQHQQQQHVQGYGANQAATLQSPQAQGYAQLNAFGQQQQGVGQQQGGLGVYGQQSQAVAGYAVTPQTQYGQQQANQYGQQQQDQYSQQAQAQYGQAQLPQQYGQQQVQQVGQAQSYDQQSQLWTAGQSQATSQSHTFNYQTNQWETAVAAQAPQQQQGYAQQQVQQQQQQLLLQQQQQQQQQQYAQTQTQQYGQQTQMPQQWGAVASNTAAQAQYGEQNQHTYGQHAFGQEQQAAQQLQQYGQQTGGGSTYQQTAGYGGLQQVLTPVWQLCGSGKRMLLQTCKHKCVRAIVWHSHSS